MSTVRDFYPDETDQGQFLILSNDLITNGHWVLWVKQAPKNLVKRHQMLLKKYKGTMPDVTRLLSTTQYNNLVKVIPTQLPDVPNTKDKIYITDFENIHCYKLQSGKNTVYFQKHYIDFLKKFNIRPRVPVEYKQGSPVGLFNNKDEVVGALMPIKLNKEK